MQWSAKGRRGSTKGGRVGGFARRNTAKTQYENSLCMSRPWQAPYTLWWVVWFDFDGACDLHLLHWSSDDVICLFSSSCGPSLWDCVNHWSCQLCCTVQNCGLWLSHKRKSWMPPTTSFNDDSWYYMERQSAQWRHQKSDETTKNGPHHQGKKIEMAGSCTAHGRRQDTKASHTMANGLMHQKKTRKAETELDWHRNSRFEVNWHGLGRGQTSSSRQRRLAWTCGPMCLQHGLN